MSDPNSPERRQGPDRRRHPRGGRRPGDKPGFAPLVMVLDVNPERRDLAEAVLAKLQFAVAPVESIEKAVSIARALRPSVIICAPADVDGVRRGLTVDVPVVAVDGADAVTDALVEVVRTALRSSAGRT